MWRIRILVAVAGCDGDGRNAANASEIVWVDAVGEIVGPNFGFDPGYWDNEGNLWLVDERDGTPQGWGTVKYWFESDDCTGDPWPDASYARNDLFWRPRLVLERFDLGFVTLADDAAPELGDTLPVSSTLDADGSCLSTSGASINHRFAASDVIAVDPPDLVWTPAPPSRAGSLTGFPGIDRRSRRASPGGRSPNKKSQRASAQRREPPLDRERP